MKIYKGHVETNIVNSRCEFWFEIEDDATDEEIRAAAREAMFEQLEWDFQPVTEGDV